MNCDLRRDWVSIKGALEDGEGRRKTSAIFLYFFNIHSFEYREEIDLPLSQRLRALLMREPSSLLWSSIFQSVFCADVQHCERCEPPMRFSMLSRRHHCRACGAAVCNTCSPMYARVVVPGWGAQPQRICVRCPVIAANAAAAAAARATRALPSAPPSAAVETMANRSGSPRSHTSGAENNRDAKSVSKNGSSVSLSQSGEDMRGALRELSYGIQLTNRMSYYVADQFLWLGMRGMVSCDDSKKKSEV